MTKQRVLTAAAVILSLFTVFGCWLLTNELLDRQHSVIMNSVHSITEPPSAESTAEPPSAESTAEPPSAGQIAGPAVNKLSIKLMADVLKNWQLGGDVRYHDPYNGQLTMEEAIQTARSDLLFICGDGTLPEVTLTDDYTQTNAFLYSMQTSKTAVMAMNPAYSFWSVDLSSNRVSMNLTLNAITGQIWMARIKTLSSSDNFDNVRPLDLLNRFESHLGLSGGGELKSNDVGATKSYEGSQVSIFVSKVKSNGHYDSISLSLTAMR